MSLGNSKPGHVPMGEMLGWYHVERVVWLKTCTPVVVPVGDVDVAAGVGGDRVHAVELPPAAAGRPPVGHVGAVGVELHDAGVAAVGDEHRAVGQERDVLRAVEVRLVVTGDALLAQRRQQLGAVVREGVDDVPGLVDHPHPPIGVVGADADLVGAVGALEERVPLRPRLGHVAVAVDDEDAVAPHPLAFLGLHGVDADGPDEAGEAGGQRIGQPHLAALGDEDAVRRLGEDAGVRAPREAGLRERLQPPVDDVVGAVAFDEALLQGGGPGQETGAHHDREHKDRRAHGVPSFPRLTT